MVRKAADLRHMGRRSVDSHHYDNETRVIRLAVMNCEEHLSHVDEWGGCLECGNSERLEEMRLTPIHPVVCSHKGMRIEPINYEGMWWDRFMFLGQGIGREQILVCFTNENGTTDHLSIRRIHENQTLILLTGLPKEVISMKIMTRHEQARKSKKQGIVAIAWITDWTQQTRVKKKLQSTLSGVANNQIMHEQAASKLASKLGYGKIIPCGTYKGGFQWRAE